MARLILTKEEKTSASYLAWDDESLGRAVKKLALAINDHHGDKATSYTACATMLACLGADNNAATTVVELEGVRDGEQQRGDWKITITKSATKDKVASKVVGRIGSKAKK